RDVHAAHLRHHDVQENQVGTLLVDGDERARSVVRNPHLEAPTQQDLPRDVDVVLVVVDHEDNSAHRPVLPSPLSITTTACPACGPVCLAQGVGPTVGVSAESGAALNGGGRRYARSLTPSRTGRRGSGSGPSTPSAADRRGAHPAPP